MTRRHYASAAAATTLAGGINPSATTVTVGSVIGWPAVYPYTAIIDYGTASEEVVLVTAGSGTTLTITRGYDSTTGLDHSIGATFIHGASAIDFDEANSHVNATTGVHGAVGELVGTTDAQDLTNKDMSSSTNIFPASLARDTEVDTAKAAAILVASPPGVVAPYAGSTAPTGWLLADGTAVSRITYANLFTVIGTTYGAGDASTTFNLPNLKGKIPVGLDAAETEFDTLGETGGEKTHTLITAEMPSHGHNVNTNEVGYSGGIFGSLHGGQTGGSVHIGYNDGAINVTGGGGAHNNLQPYISLNYIVKT